MLLADRQLQMKARLSAKPKRESARKPLQIKYFCNKCAKEIPEPAHLCGKCEENKLWDIESLRRLPGRGIVYFVQATNGGPIKIGYTQKEYISRRIKELQTGNPYPLRFIGIINNVTLYDEKNLHTKFKDLRLSGEWFSPDNKLIDYIKSRSTRCLLN